MFNYQFRPSLLGFVIVVCCVATFIKLGGWQYAKAEYKLTLQAKLEQGLKYPPADLPASINKPEDWRYKQVKFKGSYETAYQILLDNQVNNGVAGYHVITPVKIKGVSRFVLVDRGWIPAPADRSQLPEIQTPTDEYEFSGHVWVPNSKIFTLEKSRDVMHTQEWTTLWENMDIQAYQKMSKLALLPIVIRLDEKSNAAGFERNWPAPNERITTHIGYAYQWYGFAVAACLIYLFVSFKKKT